MGSNVSVCLAVSQSLHNILTRLYTFITHIIKILKVLFSVVQITKVLAIGMH